MPRLRMITDVTHHYEELMHS